MHDGRHLKWTNVKHHSFVSLKLEIGKWLASRHDRLITKELTTPPPGSNVWEAGWALQSVSLLWKEDKFLSPTWNRTPYISQYTDSAVRTPDVKADVPYMNLCTSRSSGIGTWNILTYPVTSLCLSQRILLEISDACLQRKILCPFN